MWRGWQGIAAGFVASRAPGSCLIGMCIHLLAQAVIAIALTSAGPRSAGAAGEALAAPMHDVPMHGIAMHGTPALPADFDHYPHVRAAPPKGGRITLGKVGTFDSLNPFIVRGEPPEGIADYVYETLMSRALDEPFSLYGLIAESIEVPADRSSVTFNLRAAARFSDGQPITADDVLFSQALLKEKGRPNHRRYYAKVAQAEKLGERRVRFTFAGDGDREMPLIMGLMPVLPRHVVDPETFEQTSLEKPVGSGAYVVDRAEPPRAIVYRRNPAWWGRDLPVSRGRFNVDEIRVELFRDDNAMLEAFRTGLVHLRLETDPSLWRNAYDFPAIRDGRVRKREFETGLPAPMRGLVLNTRRPLLADARVRRALVLALDFEWINANLYQGLFTRTESFFHGSELSAFRRPADAGERALLSAFPDAVAADAMDGTRTLGRPAGASRDTLRASLGFLEEAGYSVHGNRLADGKGNGVSLEMLAANRAQERLMLAYGRRLGQLGISARVRLVDPSEYESRKRKFDFDMIQATWAASLSPGNEQAFRWGSRAAEAEGSFNYPGVRSPAADAMIEALLTATTREDFVRGVRALDRVLVSGDFVVPLFHAERQWVAHWSFLHPSPSTPLFGYDLTSWWVETGK